MIVKEQHFFKRQTFLLIHPVDTRHAACLSSVELFLQTYNLSHLDAVQFELPRFKILPVQDQVVFQNDSIELSCASIWQPRGELQWEFDRHSFTDMSVRRIDDLRSRENKTVLHIKR